MTPALDLSQLTLPNPVAFGPCVTSRRSVSVTRTRLAVASYARSLRIRSACQARRGGTSLSNTNPDSCSTPDPTNAASHAVRLIQSCKHLSSRQALKVSREIYAQMLYREIHGVWAGVKLVDVSSGTETRGWYPVPMVVDPDKTDPDYLIIEDRDGQEGWRW